jgi:ring-1,2-phenylacetyl-CoA epoxidase subunit PaaE
MAKSHLLTINSIIRETPEAVSLHFALPESLHSEFTFTAGQYLTLEADIDGTPVRRSYSLCSTPYSGTLAVVVKEVVDGYFSKFANRQLQVGDSLRVFPPEGRFTFVPDAYKTAQYVGIVAGSGITPVFSIIQSVLEKEPNSQFLLIYGNKSPEETIFYKSLEQLKNTYPNRLFVEYVFSRVNEPQAQFGRIDASIINYFVKNKYRDFKAERYFVCGPEGLLLTVENTLSNHGISKDQISHELFSTIDQGSPIATVKSGDSTRITILLDNEETTFEMSRSQVVLDAALDQGIDPPYSCQGGICSSCIARVVVGQAEMRKNQILTDGEVAEGLILTCQAQPTTDVLKVDYDDI